MTLLGPEQAARRILEAIRAGQRVVAVVVTGGSATAGRRSLLVDGERVGSLGSPALDRAAADAAEHLFDPREARGARTTDVAVGEERVTLYLELHAPRPAMVIVGAGHVAQPLCTLGTLIGFSVEVLDDRAEFASAERFPEAAAVRTIDFRDPFRDTVLRPTTHVILVTRGHRFDYECLVRILRMEEPPGYVGMIGSRRRVRATHEQLVAEGLDLEAIRRVRAPVGLDLGGQTPAEIAVSVIAEIIQLREGGTGMPLSEKERIVERFFGASDDDGPDGHGR